MCYEKRSEHEKNSFPRLRNGPFMRTLLSDKQSSLLRDQTACEARSMLKSLCESCLRKKGVSWTTTLHSLNWRCRRRSCGRCRIWGSKKQPRFKQKPSLSFWKGAIFWGRRKQEPARPVPMASLSSRKQIRTLQVSNSWFWLRPVNLPYKSLMKCTN